MKTLLAALMLCSLAACGGCPPSGADAGPDGPFGQVRARAVTGGFDVELVSLERPVRAVQIEILLDGANATAAAASGTLLHDLVEGGLDAPKATFVLVVGDTRGILLDEGVIARVSTTGPGSVTFGAMTAVDETGAKQTLTSDGGS
jgi:hypothetical protein